MNILLTGATGFVGQNFLKYLSKENKKYQIFAISRKHENSLLNNVTWIKDESNYHTILTINQIDIVIHLAGKAHDTKNTTAADEYFKVNYEMTKQIFDAFNVSKASKFIFLSTIKAVGDDKTYIQNALDLTEPQTPYAQAKRKAEIYIQNATLTSDKSFYVLRPCLIYGDGVKGNLATLVKFAKKGIPYPFSAFENKRSYLSVDNLSLLFCKLIDNNYSSFTLNIANDDPIGTQEMIEILSSKLGKKASKITIPESLIEFAAKMGDILPFIPFNSEKLKKITESFVVDTAEMNKLLGFSLPHKTRETISRII
jgi:nucleoside-diphosphate-sugar epimerase